MENLGPEPWRNINPVEYSHNIDEAKAAVRAVANELSYAEVRRRLAVELRIRGIMPPPPLVDRLAMDIKLGTTFGGRVHRTGSRSVAGIQLANFGMRAAWAFMHRQQLPSWSLGGVRRISADLTRQSRVHIDPAAQDTLNVGSEDMFEIWFGEPVSEGGSGKPVAVYRGDERVGFLDPEADDLYRDAISQAYRSNLVPVIEAVRIRAEGDTWALYIGGPRYFPRPSDQ